MSRSIRPLIVLAVAAAGCSSGQGCGGAFRTTRADGAPFVFRGQRLPNAAQLRVTRGGLDFFDAAHLNDVLSALNAGAAGGFAIPCVDAGTLLDSCIGPFGFHFSAMVGDQNFDDACSAGEGPRLYTEFRDVSWDLSPATNTLKAHLLVHVHTGSIYVRTKEAHSSFVFCGSQAPIQARVFIDDEHPGLPRRGTQLDLDLQLTAAPDGRLQLNVSDASLAGILANFQPGAFFIDGKVGADAPAPALGVLHGNGCSSNPASATYSVSNGVDLNCASAFNWMNASCDFADDNQQGWCKVLEYVRGYLLEYVKNTLRERISAVLRREVDDRRCVRPVDAAGAAHDCSSDAECGEDDDGRSLSCDVRRGVCVSPGQSGGTDCEPAPIRVAGALDMASLTDAAGFPSGAQLDVFAGLGSKGAAAVVDARGVQISATAGTDAPAAAGALCAPPAAPPTVVAPTALDFDAPVNQPTSSSVDGYAFGFSLASALLNRGLADAYNAGLLCVAVTDRATSLASTSFFRAYLPSVDLLTGHRDLPMTLVFRPSAPPSLRVGRDATGADGTGDPLLRVRFSALNLDFYAPVDERQVRLFTLRADVDLPLGLRVFPDVHGDTLQPVLGAPDTLLTNVQAIGPDGAPYDGAHAILAEDANAIRDLAAVAVRLAQPLLGGTLQPIALPSLLGLRLEVLGAAGAIPQADLATDGYQHVAIWARVDACNGACAAAKVRTQARLRSAPAARLAAAGAEGHPEPQPLELDLSADGARTPEFSVRVDGGLWGPWTSGPRLAVRDPLLLGPGRHLVEVTAREAGDDRSMDPSPQAFEVEVRAVE